MGFARCGVEVTLWNILNSTRKKPFHFFCKFEKLKMVFAREQFFLWNFGYHLARTSQSPFPLCAMVQQPSS